MALRRMATESNHFSPSRRVVIRLLQGYAATMILAALAGCGTYQNLIILDIRSAVPEEILLATGDGRNVNVAVSPFRDHRPVPGIIGRYTHFGGKEAPLVVQGTDLGEVLALDTIDYLNRTKGWQTWIDKPSIVTPTAGVDLNISAYVSAWTMEVTDWGLWISVRTAIEIEFQIASVREGLRHSTTIAKEKSKLMRTFDTREMERMLTVHFHEGLDELLQQSRDLLPVEKAER
jgi:hypothetical protein